MKFFASIRFFLVFAFCLCSCQKITIDISTSVENQRILLSKFNKRQQVVHASIEDKGLVIKFDDKKSFVLDNSIIPIVSDIKGYWAINGITSSIRVNHDSSGKPVLPNASVGENGNWFFDNKDTRQIINEEYYNSKSLLDDSIVLAFLWGDSISFVLRGGEILRIPIINDATYLVPDYFFDHLVEKEKKAESLLKDDNTSFVFFTDAHWGANFRHSPALIKHIVDYTPFTRVIFGGDVVTYYEKEPQKALEIGYDFQKAFAFLGPDLYSVFGNHDDNSSGQSDAVENHLSESQVYSYLQSQMTDVHYGGYYNFFFDDEKNKTRYLCLDTGRYYYYRFRFHTLQTAQFMIDALNTVPSGWNVIAVSHIWTNLVSLETGECRESKYIKPLITILEDYNDRSGGTFSFEGKKIAYDFSEGSGKVVFCIGGHTHADYVVMSEGGIPLITISSDGTTQVAGTPYKRGTITEQCVCIFVTDYENNKLHIVHVARGEDTVVDLT